jgi:hypothetical protein
MGWNKNDGIERPWLEDLEANAAEIARELEEERRLKRESAASDEATDEEDLVDEDDPETWDDEKFEQMAQRHAAANPTSDDASDDEGNDPWGDDDDDDPDPDYGPLRKIPAYALCMKLATEAVKLGQQIPDDVWRNDDLRELFWDSAGSIAIPAAKMAGGHSFGYDTNICGNIACNRIGLEALDKSIEGFAELEQAGVLPAAYRDQVVPRLGELRRLIVERIETMRKRVWW